MQWNRRKEALLMCCFWMFSCAHVFVLPHRPDSFHYFVWSEKSYEFVFIVAEGCFQHILTVGYYGLTEWVVIYSLSVYMFGKMIHIFQHSMCASQQAREREAVCLLRYGNRSWVELLSVGFWLVALLWISAHTEHEYFWKLLNPLG